MDNNEEKTGNQMLSFSKNADEISRIGNERLTKKGHPICPLFN